MLDFIRELDNEYSRVIFTASYDYLIKFIEKRPELKDILITTLTPGDPKNITEFNIAPHACHDLIVGSEGLSFVDIETGLTVELGWGEVLVIRCPQLSNFYNKLWDPFGLNLTMYQQAQAATPIKQEERKEVTKKRSKIRLC